jgi:hypothetical protein
LQRTVDGKNYWTFEYDLEAPGYGVSAFATVAIGNGMIPMNGKRSCVSLRVEIERDETLFVCLFFALTRSVLHADRDRERAPVEQAAEQAQSRRGLLQDLGPDGVIACFCDGLMSMVRQLV